MMEETRENVAVDIQSSNIVFTFQVNKKIACNNNKTKEQLREDLGDKKLGLNTLKNWRNLSGTADSLFKVISKGASYRGCVKVGGNSKGDIEYVSFIALDFDDKEWKESDITGDPFFQKHANMWHRSPSWTDEWHKTRVIIIFDKPLSTDESETLLRYFLRKYPTADKAAKDAGRWFYGARNADWVFPINLDNTLPTDKFLAKAYKEEEEISNEKTEKRKKIITGDQTLSLSNTVPVSNTSHTDSGETGGVTEQFLRHIQSHLSSKFNKFYDIYNYIYDSYFHPDEEGNFRGINPFKIHEGEESTKGLKVTEGEDPDMPGIWYEYFKSDHGNILQYYFKVAKIGLLKKGKRRLYKGKELDEVFTRVCKDFCIYFDLPLFQFKTGRKKKSLKVDEFLKDIYAFISETLPKYVYRAGWESSKSTFIYYKINEGLWTISNNINDIYASLITPLISNEFNKDIALNSDVIQYITNILLRDDIFNVYRSKLFFDEENNPGIIPLKDGDFDLKNKLFVDRFDEGIKNDYRFNAPYKNPKECKKNVDRVISWIKDVYDKNQAKMIISWLIVNAQCLGHKLDKILAIYGTPGTGKSVVGNLVTGMMQGVSMTEDYDNFLGEHNSKFSFQSLDGKKSIYIDEFVADNKAWIKLKKITGNKKPIINIEKKGLSPYQIRFTGLITTTTQDRFIIPNSDDGGIRRRLMLLKHTPEMKNPKYRNIDDEFSDRELLNDLFIWCIHQDGDEAIQNIHNYDGNQSRELMYDVAVESDNLLAFLIDRCEVTGEQEDFISNQEMFEEFDQWFTDVIGYDPTQTQQHKIKPANISRYITGKVSRDNKFDAQVIPNSSKYNNDIKRMQRGLRGIKIKS